MFYKIIKEKEYLRSQKHTVGTFILLFQLNMIPLLELMEILKYLSEVFFELLFSRQQHFKNKKKTENSFLYGRSFLLWRTLDLDSEINY